MTCRLGMAILTAGLVFADSKNQVFSDFTTPSPLPKGSTLVIGVVGGWERWDAPQRIVRRVALKIRDQEIPGVHVETVENHKIELAEELVRQSFPTPGDANIVLYGNSLGGSATMRFAQRLQDLGYRVQMMVVIDSVGKGDEVVPANVSKAINIFQRDSWPVVGQSEITAADPSKTTILGNLKFSYKGKSVDLETEPWVRRTFTKGHLMLEYDPEVWALVERHILSAVPPPERNRSAPAARSSEGPTATVRRPQ